MSLAVSASLRSVNSYSPATKRHNPRELNPLNCSFRYSLIITNNRVIKWRKMRWVKHVAGMGKRRGVYRRLVGNPEGKRPLGRPRRRCEDNINIMDLQKVVCGCMGWIELAHDKKRWQALVNAVMNLWVP